MDEIIIIPAAELPFSFDGCENQYGTIKYGVLVCPGVYYVVITLRHLYPISREYIVVTEDSPAIPPKARDYGKLLSTTPPVLLYKSDYFDKDRWVVEYESYKYMKEHNLPLPEKTTLWETQLRGMEVCPEYFGEFPVPTNTPWGLPVQHDHLGNGLDWLKTENGEWVLAIAYPLCDDLTDQTQNWGLLLKEDEEKLKDRCNVFSCRFYTRNLSSLVLFELLICDDKQPWVLKINRAALHNTVLEMFPNYVAEWEKSEPDLPDDLKIRPTPGAGINFYPLP